MKKVMFALLGVAALAGSSCSKAPECTEDMMKTKFTELTTAMQAITADPTKVDPAKMTELVQKAQEMQTKFAGQTKLTAESCKAMDDLIKTIKG